MAKKMTKGEISAFMGAASKMLVALGGVPTENALDPKHELTLNTIAGPLRCHVYDNWIAMQFDDEKKAKELIHFGNLNPYSGKWNWMYDHPEPSDIAGLMIGLTSIAVQDFGLAGQSLLANTTGVEKFGSFANTILSYAYRDSDGCQANQEIVFRGSLSLRTVQSVLACCDRSTGVARFVPGMVGLPDLQDQLQPEMWNPKRTLPWHEITALTATNEWPTAEEAADHLVDFIRSMTNVVVTTGWNEDYKPPFYGEMIQAYAESIAKGPLNWSPSGGSPVALIPLSTTDDQDIEALVRKTPFVLGYVVAALWTQEDELPQGSAIQNVSAKSLRKAYSDCEAFVAANVDFLSAAYDIYPSSGDGSSASEQAGHDFWLTRNGHGDGYWDRGLGHIGDKLTEAAKIAGGCDLVGGDDGKLHFEGGDVVKALLRDRTLRGPTSSTAKAGPSSGSAAPAP